MVYLKYSISVWSPNHNRYYNWYSVPVPSVFPSEKFFFMVCLTVFMRKWFFGKVFYSRGHVGRLVNFISYQLGVSPVIYPRTFSRTIYSRVKSGESQSVASRKYVNWIKCCLFTLKTSDIIQIMSDLCPIVLSICFEAIKSDSNLEH